MKTAKMSGLLILVSLAIVQPASAAPIVEPSIVAPQSTVTGRTIGEWTAEWWRWAFSLGVPDDPFTDATGEDAGNNQTGPVFFVAGTTGGDAVRSFSVPRGNFLLVPLVNVAASELTDPPADTEQEL